MMGTSMSLSSIDNIRLIYMMEKHLIELMKDSDFKGIFSNTACPLNIHICKKIFGYTTLKEFPAKRFVDKNGERPFENVDDSVIKVIQIYENPDYK